MACDYQAIRRDNEQRYGTDIGRIGPMLVATNPDAHPRLRSLRDGAG